MLYNTNNEKNPGYIKNMEVIGYSDLDGIYPFQPQLYKTETGKYYLYQGAFKGPVINILDVTDPTKPTIVNKVIVADDNYKKQSAGKIQVAGDLLLVGLGGGLPELHGVKMEDKNLSGLMIYSLKNDPEKPEFLSFWSNSDDFMSQVHRFTYNGGRYVHLTATAPGFYQMIYRILDIEDPKNPKEVGRWWLKDQNMDVLGDAKVKELYKGFPPGFNYPGFVHFVYADEENGKAYLSCAGAGFKIVDISDVTRPKTLGEIDVCPPFSNKWGGARCHTFMPIRGTKFAVGLQEGERVWCTSEERLRMCGTQSYCGIQMYDVSDPTDPTLVSIFPYPEVPEEFPYQNFNHMGSALAINAGPHNIHEPMTGKPWADSRTDRIYNCYFHAGLRVYDISDPYVPKEIAYFIPPNPEKVLDSCQSDIVGPFVAETEDLVVDDRGNIFMNTSHDGLYVVRCLV